MINIVPGQEILPGSLMNAKSMQKLTKEKHDVCGLPSVSIDVGIFSRRSEPSVQYSVMRSKYLRISSASSAFTINSLIHPPFHCFTFLLRLHSFGTKEKSFFITHFYCFAPKLLSPTNPEALREILNNKEKSG